MSHESETENKSHGDTPEDIVNEAIERMKTGAVVKEQRISHVKTAVISAVILTALAAYMTFDFIYRKPSSEVTASGATTITIKQSQNGSYLARGKVNGHAMKFVVDTGATKVVIPLKLAKKIDLPLGFRVTTVTANGYGTAFETLLESVTLGDITLHNIEASASDGLVGDEALLGMSFLKKIKLTQDKGLMTITSQ